jgi:pilus assembly protein CpaC
MNGRTKKTGALLTAAAIIGLSAAVQAQAQTADGAREDLIELTSNTGPVTRDLSVPAGKSSVLRFDRPIADVLVGDPEVADVIPLTDRSIYVIGKEIGRTSLTLFSRGKQLAGVIDLNVTHDLFGLKKRLYETMPSDGVEVRADGPAIILSGSVSDSAAAAKASALAQNYAGKDGGVINMMSVRQSQQVMIAVRFAEVQRTALKDVGINADIFFNSGKEVGALQTGRQIAQNYVSPAFTANSFIKDAVSDPEKFGAAFGKFSLGDVSFDLLLDALEKKGIVSVLAEPNLIAVSGETASFLAGGEFPVPVTVDSGESQGRIGIEFKEFGVRLAFTPTVLGQNINLLVEPEVSELDPQSGISVDQIIIPGLTTRRARTTIDLKNGQSFAIAGLLQKKFIDDVDQMPGIGDVPVLGALARSASYRREDTELAIIITAYLVEPSTLAELTTPWDAFSRPHELELFLLGKTEGARVSPRAATALSADPATRRAQAEEPGVDGPVGFVVK